MSLDTSQKLPLGRSLNQIAERRAHDVLQQTGKALPASVVSSQGWIVTVKFEVQGTTLVNVTVPVASSKYDYLPLQPGDTGLLVPSDVYLGGISGLGGGTASLNLPANLSALLFVPNGNKSFAAPADVNKRYIYGPDGAVVSTLDGSVSVTVDKTAGVTIKVGAHSWVFGADGTFKAPGNIFAGVGGADQVDLQLHVHPANGQPPTPGS
jgi:hypothetical protein